MKNDDRIFVFVYGSLKRGYELESYLKDQKYIGTACTARMFRLFDLGSYPGMVRVAANGLAVKGELYNVDYECLLQLDRVEGVDEGYYRREAVPLQSPYNSHTAYAYLFLHSLEGCSDCGDEWPCVTD